MKNLKFFLFLFLCVCIGKHGYSQYYYYNDKYYDNDLIFEFGVGLGAMNCITDVGGANTDNGFYINEIRKQNTKFSKSIFGSVMYQNFVGARIEGTWGSIQSADKDIQGKTANVISRNARNLSFRSNITELSMLAEFHPLMLLNYENSPPLLSPYFVAGIGWYSFNPQTSYNGHWIDLKPLRTEGQGFAEYRDVEVYKTSQTNVPIGLGVRYELSALFNLRLEFLHRILFTDYLDDASSRKYVDPAVFVKNLNPVEASYAQALYNRSLNGKIPARRGNPNNNDTYMSFSLKVGLVLGRQGR